jgi:hypothetical protein
LALLLFITGVSSVGFQWNPAEAEFTKEQNPDGKCFGKDMHFEEDW